MKRALLIGLAALCVSCSPPSATQGEAEAPATAAATEDQGERFYGEQSFTIEYVFSGRQTGTRVEHARDWGRTRAVIENSQMSVAGITARTNNRVVSVGALATTINLDNGTATSITNPLYDQIIAQMQGRTGVEFGREMMVAMGGVETGETGDFAGHSCRYWTLAQLGLRVCVTDWGATLHSQANLGGIAIEWTATAVRIGDGGPDEAFAIPDNVTQGPDLGGALERMKGL